LASGEAVRWSAKASKAEDHVTAGIHRCRAFALNQGWEGGAAIWHLLNIVEVNELADRSTIRNFRIVRSEGSFEPGRPYPASQ
jgi:hypothetical protein